MFRYVEITVVTHLYELVYFFECQKTIISPTLETQ